MLRLLNRCFLARSPVSPVFQSSIFIGRSYGAAVAGFSYRDNESNAGTKKNSVISVPLRLEKRLEQKAIRDRSKYEFRKRMVQASRKGSKTVVISARHPELNHYHGQSYGSNEDVPLVSKGWAHRKAGAAHDHFKIHAHGKNAALPDLEDEKTFNDLGLIPSIVAVLEQKGIRQPTIIQATAIPKLLKGLSCMLSAETGCGKTLAYLLPIFQQILDTKRRRNYQETSGAPLALVLVPTRELADQVANVAEDLGKKFDIRVKLVQGGNIGSKVKNPPSTPVDLIVSTVNVLSELTKYEVYSMSRVRTIILDEADTLTDDSFCDDVLKFISPFSFTGTDENKVQLCLVSATMPKSLDTELSEKLAIPNLVTISTPGLHMIMKHVPQTFLRVKKLEKPLKILEMLKEDRDNGVSTIVFCNKADTCTWLSHTLEENGIACIPLSKSMLPKERKEHLKLFLSQEVPVLVATDLGSRGIDTIQTGHVINYDFPAFISDYVHRCGRTGRVGSKVQGQVTSLIAWPGEVALVQRIEKAVRKDTCFRRVDANIKKHLTAKYGYGMGKPILPVDD